MINKQRVRRIKNAIQTAIVILFFLPFVLMIVLSIVMIGSLNSVTRSLGAIESYIVGEVSPSQSQNGSQAPEQSGGESALVPENQAFHPQDREPSGGDEDSEASSRAEEPAAEDSAGGTADTSPGAESAAPGTVPNTYSPDTYPQLCFDNLVQPTALPSGTLYLTIDNTPASNFDDILSVLDKHGVKATFFVWWGESGGAPSAGPSFRAIHNAGHSIGIHSGAPATPLSKLYSDFDVFMTEFSEIFEKIEAETGVQTRLYRLPGGSVNPYNPRRQAVLAQIKEELDRRGFLQYDWNVSAEDAVYPPLSMQQILDNLYTNVEKGNRIVALVHDGTGSDSTVRALDEFIARCLDEGYTFRALDNNTVPVSFLDQQ